MTYRVDGPVEQVLGVGTGLNTDSVPGFLIFTMNHGNAKLRYSTTSGRMPVYATGLISVPHRSTEQIFATVGHLAFLTPWESFGR